MLEEGTRYDRRRELADVIREVRRRWRMKLALRALVIILAGSALILILSAAGLQAFRFAPVAVVGFRVVALAGIAALLASSLLTLFRRQVSDTQVALYVEEHDPSLQAAILSAVEAASSDSRGQDPTTSARLVDRLVHQAVERCRTIDHGRSIERAGIRLQLARGAAIAAAAVLLVISGPAYVRHGLSALLVISRSAEAASPYRIEVRPGNAVVPRGSDQPIAARLVGFTADSADLVVRKGRGAAERVPLVSAGRRGGFETMLFHVDQGLDYFVEAGGVRSPVFTMKLTDLPAVARLEIEYRYPAYTHLPPKRVPNGGDIAALRGTEVRLRVVPTVSSPGGSIRLSESSASSLLREADGSLTGGFTIDRAGSYRIELLGPHGERVPASPQYTIDVIADQPPSVSFVKPSRDIGATPVEEVFVQARAQDDYGVKKLELRYSVNGDRERSVTLFDGQPDGEVGAARTLYLEDLGLKPGDFVSYYARAIDNDGVDGPQTGTSDIYFVRIRPFKRDYRAAESQASGGGGNEVNALSEQQKQIVAATFNVARDRKKSTAQKLRENAVFLALSQGKLRAQVE